MSVCSNTNLESHAYMIAICSNSFQKTLKPPIFDTKNGLLAVRIISPQFKVDFSMSHDYGSLSFISLIVKQPDLQFLPIYRYNMALEIVRHNYNVDSEGLTLYLIH